MTVTVANLAARLSSDAQYVPRAHDTVFYNTDALIGNIIPMRGLEGGTGVKLTVITAGNDSAEVYTEGQSPPARGNLTTITVTFGFKHFRVFIGETGHARRAQLGMGLLHGDQDLEVDGALKKLRDLITRTFLTDGVAHSILGIIDATTNFGDASRATYTTLKSYELAAAAAGISTSIMNKAYNRSRERPYGANVQLWVASPTQTGKYAEVVSGKVAPTTAVGAELIPRSIDVGGNPWLPLPDLATSTVLGMTDVDGLWGARMHEDGNLGGVNGSGINVKYMGAQDDSDTIQLSTALAIYCTGPQKQVKISGLSAA